MDNKEDNKINPEILFSDHLCAAGKIEYINGKRPKVDCIFCEIVKDNPAVTSLKLYQNSQIMICFNLYPYNPGHLMVIPIRHVEKFEDLTLHERQIMFNATINMQKMLKDHLMPTGFNVGYNEGDYSGASIRHIHIHVVPRYKSELGFIDIIGQTKIVVQRASEILALLKPKIQLYMDEIC